MNLICFGDSWTAGHGVESNKYFKELAHPHVGNEYIVNLRKNNGWPKWLSEKLNCTFVNFANCGCSNGDILKEIKNVIKELEYFQKHLEEPIIGTDDIIIVMLSYPYRGNELPQEIFKEIENILKPYKHYYFNSFYPTFKDEKEFDTTTLPITFINPTGCVSDILRDYEIKNNISVWEYESRSVWNDEKNFYEGDYHPNLLGYKIIANYIYNQIKSII